MYIKRYLFSLLTILILVSGVALNAYALDSGFGASDKNGEWSTETHANIFHTMRYDNNLLYPGASNVYSFKVQNDGSKYIKCQLTIEDKNEYKIPMEFKLKKNGKYVIGSEDTWYESPKMDTGLYEFRGTDEYELEWRWVYLLDDENLRSSRNEYDTSLGVTAFTTEEPYYLNIVLYGEGADEPSIIIPEDPDPSKPEEPSRPDESSIPNEPEPSNPSNPSKPTSFIDTILTGDSSYIVCIYFGLILVVSLTVIYIGGRIDEKINKNKQ